MTDPAHPLFLNDNNEEPPEVGHIHIVRWEKGQKFQVPKAFTAEELTSLEQIKDMFGGGHYELIARDYNNRISRRIRVNLPGASKRLTTDDAEEEETDAPFNSQNIPPVAAAPAFPVEGIMGMFMHSMTAQMQMQMQQSQMQMQMMQAANEAARVQAAEQSKMMIALMTAQPKQDMTPLIIAIMQSSSEMFKMLMTKGGGMGSSEILEAIQIGTNLVKGAQEGAGPKPGSAEEMVASFVAGIQALRAGGGMPPGMMPPGMAGMIPGVQMPVQEQQFPPQQPQQQPTQPNRRRRPRVVEPAEPASTAGVAEVEGEETGT